jgi:hypothetical protein
VNPSGAAKRNWIGTILDQTVAMSCPPGHKGNWRCHYHQDAPSIAAAKVEGNKDHTGQGMHCLLWPPCGDKESIKVVLASFDVHACSEFAILNKT